MSAPRLLDLFSGAGGCAVGYARAGFEVVGIDLAPQPNNPLEFVQMDALEFLREQIGFGGPRFDVVHASPPCQFATAYRRRPGHVKPSLNLIPQTRALLEATGLPYVIENIEQARAELRNPTTLCGSMFGLGVRRHRLFETNFALLTPTCDHASQQGDWPQATNRENRRKTAEIGVWRIPLEDQKRAMGVDWDCTLHELSQMVPPSYTELIGLQLRETIERNSSAEGRRDHVLQDRGLRAKAQQP